MTAVLKYKVGNVVEQTFDEPTLLIHVCNTFNGYGSGVAGAIARKYPNAKKRYHQWFKDREDILSPFASFTLGNIQFVDVADNLIIVNMLAQCMPGGNTFFIGGEEVHLRPIRLDSLRECLLRVASIAKKNNLKVVGPMFAGGLAGANFDLEVVPLIEECLLKYNIDVTIYKLEVQDAR